MTDLANVTVERPTCVKIARSRRKAPSKPATVTATQVREHLGLTRQRIGALADTEHVIERLPDGRFDQDDARLRYLRWLRDQRRSARSEAASEFSKAKTELIRMRIEEKKRDLIPMTEATDTIDKICGIMLTHMSGMAARCGGHDLQVRRRIEEVVFQVRTEISAAATALADARGEPPEETEA
jgi:hypothetical protein